MGRDHEAESFLLALSRIEREAAARLGPGVTLALGPRMRAALVEAQAAPVQSVEQCGPIVHIGPNT